MEITNCDVQTGRENGAAPRAVEVSLYVVRAFVRLRETLAAHKSLAAKLEELEQKTEALALRDETLATNTRAKLQQVFEARCWQELHVRIDAGTTPSPFLFLSARCAFVCPASE